MNKSTSAPAQTIYFTCALILVFLRFSLLHETITFLTGRNTYLLYIFAPVALFGVVASNGLQRVFRAWPAKFWLGFVICMVLAVPFSSWKAVPPPRCLLYPNEFHHVAGDCGSRNTMGSLQSYPLRDRHGRVRQLGLSVS